MSVWDWGGAQREVWCSPPPPPTMRDPRPLLDILPCIAVINVSMASVSNLNINKCECRIIGTEDSTLQMEDIFLYIFVVNSFYFQ